MRRKNLGPTAGTTGVLWYLAVLSPGAFASPGLLVFPGFWDPAALRALSVVLLRI